MVPTSDKGRFCAFGRALFSTSIVFLAPASSALAPRRIMMEEQDKESCDKKSCGPKAIQGPHYKPGIKKDLNVKNIQRTVPVWAAQRTIAASRSATQWRWWTLTTIKDETQHRGHKVQGVAGRAGQSIGQRKELPRLVKGLTELSKSDPLVVYECSGGQLPDALCMRMHAELRYAIVLVPPSRIAAAAASAGTLELGLGERMHLGG